MACKDFELEMVVKARDEASKVLGGVGDAAKRLGIALAAIASAAVAAAVLAGDSFAEFEQGLLNIQAASDGTRQDFDALKVAAMEAASSTRFNPTETVDALYDLSSAGLSAAQAIEALNPVLTLAAATNASLGRTSENVTMIMGQFGLKAEQTTAIADTLTAAISASTLSAERIAVAFRNSGATAHAMGQSFEATTAALGVLSNSFNSGEAAGTGLKSLFAELNQNSEKFGIQMRTAKGEVRPLVDIIESMARAGWNADKAVSQFGADAGPTLAILLSSGADALREMESKVQSNGQAARAAETQNSGLKAALTGLSGAYDTLVLKMGEAVSSGQKLAAEQMTWFLQLPQVVWATKALGESVGSLGQYVVPILLKVGNAGIWLHNQITLLGQTRTFRWLGEAVSWFGWVFTEAFHRIDAATTLTGGIWDELVTGFGDLASFVVSSIIQITGYTIGWETTGSQAATGIANAYLWVRDVVRELRQVATAAFVSIGAAFRENGVTSESVGKGLAATFRWIRDVLVDLGVVTGTAFSGIGSALQSNGVTTKSVLTGIVDGFRWVGEAIVWSKNRILEWWQVVGPAFQAVLRVVGILSSGIGDAFGKIGGRLKEMEAVKGFAATFGTAVGTAVGTAKSSILDFVSAVASLSPDALKIMTRELNAMHLTAGAVSRAIVGWFDHIVKTLKELGSIAKQDFMEAASPSIARMVKTLEGLRIVSAGTSRSLIEGFDSVVESFKVTAGQLIEFKDGFLKTYNDVKTWLDDMQPGLLLIGKIIGITAAIIGLLCGEVVGFFNVLAIGFGGMVANTEYAYEKISQGFGKIRERAREMAGNIRASIADIVDNTFGWFSRSFDRVSNTIGGIVDGLANRFSQLADRVRATVSWIINAWNRVSGGGGGGEDSSGGTSQVDEMYYDQGYASGTTYIPRNGIYALHQGEQVISNASSSTTFGDFTLNLNGGNGGSGFSRDEWRRIVRDIIAPELGYLGGR
ncbi:MAG: phage tail tape measure protein [Magnetococcales bacterium]|nr:phage tail tape measure protein [Magnetococcales bacterium]